MQSFRPQPNRPNFAKYSFRVFRRQANRLQANPIVRARRVLGIAKMYREMISAEPVNSFDGYVQTLNCLGTAWPLSSGTSATCTTTVNYTLGAHIDDRVRMDALIRNKATGSFTTFRVIPHPTQPAALERWIVGDQWVRTPGAKNRKFAPPGWRDKEPSRLRQPRTVRQLRTGLAQDPALPPGFRRKMAPGVGTPADPATVDPSRTEQLHLQRTPAFAIWTLPGGANKPITKTSPDVYVPPRKPGLGVKERKVRAPTTLAMRFFKVLDQLSETAEIVDAFFSALPEDIQKAEKAKAIARHRLIDAAGQYGIDGADWKLAALARHWDKVDFGAAIENVAKNELEDQLIGFVNQRVGRVYKGPSDMLTSFVGKKISDAIGKL